MTSEALQSAEFSGWHEYHGAQASDPLPLAGTELAIVFVSAEMNPGDRLEARVEGRRRGSDWHEVPERVVVQNPMKVKALPASISMPITVNIKRDSFDEVRVIWSRTSGSPQNVVARAALRKVKMGDSEVEWPSKETVVADPVLCPFCGLELSWRDATTIAPESLKVSCRFDEKNGRQHAVTWTENGVGRTKRF